MSIKFPVAVTKDLDRFEFSLNAKNKLVTENNRKAARCNKLAMSAADFQDYMDDNFDLDEQTVINNLISADGTLTELEFRDYQEKVFNVKFQQIWVDLDIYQNKVKTAFLKSEKYDVDLDKDVITTSTIQ